ncbi:MAG: hypothetical protein GX228_01100 [Firmicutes bacterium]|jgi:peptide/nickel transport system substrate-binding protein|nr:ABC transporter substrate-binding protein [Bacillota bacterium]NLL87511.1 hypothetical protein [Bacillota bacterium]
MRSKTVWKRVFEISLLMLMLVGGTILAAAKEETINIAVPTDPDSFDPTRSVAAATAEIAFNIYEGLVKSTPDGQLTGALASHWEIDSSQTVYTFYLREAYFHNGTQVTADDVVNALDRARDPQISQRAGNYQAIASVHAQEGNQVVITLKEPYAPLLYELTELAAAVYPKDAAGLDNRPIGTGPYKLEEWRPNQYIKLTRFDRHWSGQQPFFRDVYFRIMPDYNSAVISLKTGNIDLIPRLEASFLHQVENTPNLAVHADPMNLVQLLAINNARPALSDLKVRQAIAMAVNRDQIIVGAAWGQGEKLYSGLSPAMPEFYNAGLENLLPYDPARAQALLNDAGYANLELTMTLPAPYPLHVQTGEIIADQLRRVGVNVRIEIVEWGTWLEKVYTQRDYDLSIVGLTGKLDPHTILSRYVSTNSRNFTNFNSAEFDRLINEGISASGPERKSIYDQAQEILAREVAAVFIMDPLQLNVLNAEIKGWQSYPIYVIDAAALYK